MTRLRRNQHSLGVFMPANDARPTRGHLDEALARVRRGLAIAFVLSGIFNVLQLALPVYSMQIFDRVLVSGSLSTLSLLSLMLVLATACSSILDWVRGLLLGAAASEVDFALSRGTLSRMDLGSRDVLRDVDALRNFVSGPLAVALLDAPWALGFVLGMFVLHFVLGVATVAALCLVLCFAWFGNNASRASYRALAAPSEQMNELLGELEGQAESELPSSRSALAERLLHLRAHSTKAIQKLSAQRSWIDATARGIRTYAQITIFGVTAVLVLRHDIQMGAIVAGSLLFGRALAPFERVAASIQTVGAARASWRRIAQRPVGVFPKEPKLTLPQVAGEIVVSNVSFAVSGGDRPILHRLSLKAFPGTVTTIIGAEGAGKSTLARLLIGALAPVVGEIRLDGSKLTDFNSQELGRHIGYLAQPTRLGTGTVSQVIAGLEEADAEAVVAAAKLAGVHTKIQSFPAGYQTRLANGTFHLSAGERQRIALARAIYRLPPMVVLDEPTTGLDDGAESTVVEIITALKRAGSTVVIISRLPALLQLSDQMFMLDNGNAHRLDLGRMESMGPRIVASSR